MIVMYVIGNVATKAMIVYYIQWNFYDFINVNEL